ncbi:NUDIX hydrolase [Paenibacillus eucommiae]|uniref:8-oxo-dGTP pyrophosphatase MutT (NUDIX family) n=1 Tax=Paenibacillus eucommiae TaxID=1355755 RepID=A0ABS4ISW6_9BACL|nr:NUDIX hydrolase [Paenibacillus eucommiae]MBP1990613.1 8-oxo-dGTP pyrophosphatase MutT (NUDIX family) [Paenibacillus eucommiae]
MGYIQDIRKLVGTRPIIMAGVSIIVLNEQNEILLQKRSDSGDWGVIGGALELGESLEQAAVRELYEEAGLQTDDLKFICLLSGADMYYKYPHGDEIYNVVAVYETRDYTGEPCINDDEGLELKFFQLDAPIDNLNEMARKILSKSNYIT